MWQEKASIEKLPPSIGCVNMCLWNILLTANCSKKAKSTVGSVLSYIKKLAEQKPEASQ